MDGAPLLEDGSRPGASSSSGSRTIGSSTLLCCVVLPQLAIGGFLIWFSPQLPVTCTSGLRHVMHWMAIDYVAVALSLGCAGVCASSTMVSNKMDRRLAQQGGRRGTPSKKESESDQTGKAFMCFALPCFCIGLAGVPLALSLWARGIVAASETPGDSCANGPAIFYIMLGTSIGLMLCACCVRRCCGRTAAAVLDDDGGAHEDEDNGDEEARGTP